MVISRRILILTVLFAFLAAGWFSRSAFAAVTSISSVTIPDHLATIDEGASGARKMLLVNISADSATTLSEVSIWLEGANLQSLGLSQPDGYERSINNVSFHFSNAQADVLALAFTGAQKFNDYYNNPDDNPIASYSNIVWSEGTYLNLQSGNNYFIIMYSFDSPTNQPPASTTTIAGERYNVRLDYVKVLNGSTIIANIMGPYISVSGDIVGTTFEIESSVYYSREQLGIPIDPVVIAAVKVTTTGTDAVWNDFLIRSEGSGDDTRVARIMIYEDTTGDGAFTPPSAGPPNDTLIDTIDLPFLSNNGQAYHLFTNVINIAQDTSKTFFFCYDFDPNAPDAVNNGFRFSFVNFGGTFRIITPYDFTTLVSPTVSLLPLPPGVDVAVGTQDPGTYSVNATPLLTERFPLFQLKLASHGMDSALSSITFQFTTTSTAVPTSIYALELYLDSNNTNLGTIDDSDILLATITHEQILASPNFFHFQLGHSLLINENTFANILLGGIFTDQAQNAYGFALFGDGLAGNFDYVRFYPATAPLYSGWTVFNTTPPVSPTPTPTPTPTATTVAPGAGDGGAGNSSGSGNDTGVGIPGSIADDPGGGCFIATAAFGTMMAKDVVHLCSIRDTSLITEQMAGLVSLYYRLGPDLADFIRDTASMRAFIRNRLHKMICPVN